MFGRVLIANRGEIAVRIARTCRTLGVEAVAVHSDVDAAARHVAAASRAVRLPGVTPADTYLNVDAVLEAARSTGAEAIHPGYGFLSESAAFADAVVAAGFVWVGPPPAAIRAVGDKISARRLAVEAGVPVVPGITDPIEDVAVLESFAAEHGYPVAIKASGGGGGRGLKVARGPEELEPAWSSARREAVAYFGSHDVFVERYLEGPKHLEVQLLAPGPDEALWLGVRDCSLQRRHQKLVEETPPPLWAERAPEMGEAAVALSKACGYVNAGTVEMLVDRAGEFYFLEVNARLQVEHTVTEEVLGLDLVECQLRIASGERLPFSQADLVPRGHAIECRINAEDPARGFAPTPGRLVRYVEPAGPGVRVDSGYAEGDDIPGAYDSLIAKLVTHGATRAEARSRMLEALRDYVVEGVETTIPAHLLLLEEESFVAGTHDTTTVESGGVLDELVVAPEDLRDVLMVGGKPVRLWNPAMAASAAAAIHTVTSGGDVVSPMQGTILKVLVSPGDEVEAGTTLVVLEAMKMENSIASPVSGVVAEVTAQVGKTAGAGQLLVRVGTAEPDRSP
jgi:acetyl-CoA/propionyl-CoA carboxylase biotin carboxyl carrier protein